LNDLLLVLGYTRLYPKSPLDGACIFILNRPGGIVSPLEEYRGFIKKWRIKDIPLEKNRKTIQTAVLRKRLARALTGEEFDAWLRENLTHFSVSVDTLLPKTELQTYIKLLLGGDSINRQYQHRLIPKVIRDWLYPMTAGKELTQKELREKLIAFAFFKNMTIKDINYMLDLAGLRKFSYPENRYEAALLAAAALAHDRFPPYEDDCLGCVIFPELEKILKHYSEKEKSALTETEIRRIAFCEKTRDDILNRIDETWRASQQYQSRPHDETEKTFEKYYTDRELDYSRCLAVYIRDLTGVLINAGIVSEKEAPSFIALLQPERDGA
jgi:hypothetical protein